MSHIDCFVQRHLQWAQVPCQVKPGSQRSKCLTLSPSSDCSTTLILYGSANRVWALTLAPHLTAYVMRSGLRALIMHSLWSEVLFFHSWGNISFSGHSDSTSFFQRLAEPSMSRSRFLKSSIEHRDWWWGEGEVGERKKKRKKYCIFKKCCCNVISDAC